MSDIGRNRLDTRERVAELLSEGCTQNEVARRLGISKSTVSYHARNLGRERDERCLRRYDWPAIQSYYDEGHTMADCRRRFGFSNETWYAARDRGDLVPRPHGMPIEELCAAPRARFHLKSRLIKAGLLGQQCATCGIDSWLDRPLSLALHHVNGDPADNRLENLVLLCPNCHSQTENFAGRNRRLKALIEDA